MSRLFVACGLLSVLVFNACSDGDVSTTPTSPTSVASITPATTVLQLAQTQAYVLTATTAPTTTTWTSSNTNALTIDEAGNATAVGVGASTITATGDAGQTATLTVQTVPIYQGDWTGQATVIACTDLAGFATAGYCARNLGATQKVTLALTQSGLSVAGTITKSEGANLVNGTVSGTIAAGGDVALTGTLAGLAAGANLQLTLISWNSLADGATMTGNWSGNVTSPQILGMATLQWSLSMQSAP